MYSIHIYNYRVCVYACMYVCMYKEERQHIEYSNTNVITLNGLIMQVTAHTKIP